MDKAALMLEAMDAAVARLLERADPPRTPEGLFAPLSETLYWIAALDEQFFAAKERPPLLSGLRYARNRITHDGVTWQVADSRDVFADRWYDGWDVWVWKGLAELPPEDLNVRPSVIKHQRPAFEKTVQGRVVLDTVLDAVDLLRGLSS